jgi:hypothetical protein
LADQRQGPSRKTAEVARWILYEYDFGDSWIHAVELEKKVDGDTFDHPSDTFIANGNSVFPRSLNA